MSFGGKDADHSFWHGSRGATRLDTASLAMGDIEPALMLQLLERGAQSGAPDLEMSTQLALSGQMGAPVPGADSFAQALRRLGDEGQTLRQRVGRRFFWLQLVWH